MRFLDDLYAGEKPPGVPEGTNEADAEYANRNGQRRSGRPVMRPELLHGRGDHEQPEERNDHDYSVEARALPVAASQVHPDPELVKGQRKPNPVND